MFAENKAEYNWLKFLSEKDIEFNKVVNKYGKIKNNLFIMEDIKTMIFICDLITREELLELTLISSITETPIVIAYSDGKFDIIHDVRGNSRYTLKDSAFICQCLNCGNWWFGEYYDSLKCKNCEEQDDDKYISNMIKGCVGVF